MAGATPNDLNVAAWDLPTRLFHWLLLALVISAYVSVEYAEDIDDEVLVWHRWNGLSILVLMVWRVLWGFAGSSTARFRTFVSGPGRALAYGRDVIRGRAAPFLGHNPLGGLMVMALIGVLVLQASFGLFAVDDNDLTGGPLHRLVDEAGNKFATRWHHRVFENILLPLIGLHIAVNLYYRIVKREPLIEAMVTGSKPQREYADAQTAQIPERPMLRAIACLVAAKLIVFGAILAIGGRLW